MIFFPNKYEAHLVQMLKQIEAENRQNKRRLFYRMKKIILWPQPLHKLGQSDPLSGNNTG